MARGKWAVQRQHKSRKEDWVTLGSRFESRKDAQQHAVVLRRIGGTHYFYRIKRV